MANVAASKVATCIVLPRDLKSEVQAHAEKTGTPMNMLVRLALERMLKEATQPELQM